MTDTTQSQLLAVTVRRKLLCKMFLRKHMGIAHSLSGERNRYWKRRYGLKVMIEKSSIHKVKFHSFDKITSSISIRFIFFYSHDLRTVCSYVKIYHKYEESNFPKVEGKQWIARIIARKSKESFLSIRSREKDCLGRMCSLHNRCF